MKAQAISDLKGCISRLDAGMPDSEALAIIGEIQAAAARARSAWSMAELSPEDRARVRVNDRALADELSARYSDREACMALVARIGFPRARVPWSGQASIFWSKVLDGLRAGVIANGIPRLIDAAFGSEDGGHELTEQAIRILARLYHEEGHARTMLLRSGFPAHHVPSFATASIFWTSVVTSSINGARGLRFILSSAASEYPGNEELAAVVRLVE